jgi:hypothetical protein
MKRLSLFELQPAGDDVHKTKFPEQILIPGRLYGLQSSGGVV